MDIYNILNKLNAISEKQSLTESAAKEKEAKKDKPPFPGSPEYEKKYGKPKNDDDSAFEKKKISTGTVYKRKLKDEPEDDKDDDDTPKKKGRKKGTGKKIGAKGPSTTSKLLTGKNKGGLKESLDAIAYQGLKESLDIEDQGEYDDEAGMARQDLHTVVDAAKELHDILASDENLPEWVQAKITKALDYIDTSRDYVKSSHADQGEAEEVTEFAPIIGAALGAAARAAPSIAARALGPTAMGVRAAAAPAPVASGELPKTSSSDSPEVYSPPSSSADKTVDEAYPPVVMPSDQKYQQALARVYGQQILKNPKFPDLLARLKRATPNERDLDVIIKTGTLPNNLEEVGYSAKAARAGHDIGKPGKNFAKIAKSSGGGEKGQRIAGAVLNKLRHRNVGEEELLPSPSLPPESGGSTGRINSPMKPGKPPNESKVSEVTPDQLDQQKMAQMKRAAATRTNSRNVQQQPPSGGPRRLDIPAGIRRARGDAPLGRDEMGENSMGGSSVAGGMAPAAGQKTFAETSSASHEIAWKAAAKAVNAIMKKRGYTGSKTDEGYMWTRKTPRGTAFVDIDFDERWPNEVRWGEGELKGAKRKDYYQSGNDNVRDLAQVIGQLFANVKNSQPSVDEADEDGKPNFAKKDSKHKPDDDGDGVPDWADKKPGEDDNEESDSNESDESEEEDDDKALKKMKSHAGIEDKDDKESDDEESDNNPQKGKKPDFGKKKDEESDDEESDDEDDSDDSDKESEDDDSDDKKSEKKSEDKPKKDTSGTPYGKSVYESAYTKQLKRTLTEGISANASADDSGKKTLTVTATDDSADKLGQMLKMAGLFSSEGYSSVCQNCGGIHEVDACGADHVDEAYGDFDIETNRDLGNSPDEHYSDIDTMTNKLSGGLNGRKSTGQTTIPVIDRQDSRQGVMGEAQKIQEAARNRLWKLYGNTSK